MILLKIICFILKVKLTLQFVSDETNDSATGIAHKIVFNQRNSDNPIETYWPDPNVKGKNFETRRNCMGDTFDEVFKRYRKMLQNDGALVDFVSSDPLPFNSTDLELNTCALNYEEIKHLKKIKDDVPIVFENGTSHKSIEVFKHATKQRSKMSGENSKFKNATVHKNETLDLKDMKNETINTATTFNPKPTLKAGFKVQNLTEEKNRRASEYMFSSIEYYDDPEEFDDSVCPDDIEVIHLEIDQLRNYDVECELIIEWRSLE